MRNASILSLAVAAVLLPAGAQAGALMCSLSTIRDCDELVGCTRVLHEEANVPRFFEAIFQNADEHVFVPGEYIVDGDRIASLGTYGCRGKATGKEAKADWVFLFTMKDGAVASYEQYQGHGIAEAFR